MTWTRRLLRMDHQHIPHEIQDRTKSTKNKLEKHNQELDGHSIEVHYSRRPFDRLTVYDYRIEAKGTATLEQHGC